MTITTTGLTKAAGICAAAAGAIFIGVQVGHPKLDAVSIQTTSVYVRDQLKVLMAVLALAGITGMYVSQLRRNGVLGLIGYVVFALGYLGIMCVAFAAAYVLPHVAQIDPRFVNDIIAVDTGRGAVKGSIGGLENVIHLQGYAYLAGGLLFGIALYRAHVLARWAAVLLALASVLTIALSTTPDAIFRLLAVPNGIAMICLGYSLWRTTRRGTTTQASAVTIPEARRPEPSADIATAAAASADPGR